ncbi:MAG: DedA family protein [Candidatus Neomarinimicrobiota bacterium]|nr:MAG: DedA family protein [Candidatus Neomarinimicrobiota bacterium]
MNWLRRMYDWVLHWAETPYGPAALGCLAFAEASFFPVPPDVLLIALALGARRRALWFATLTSVASVSGAILGYGIGYFAWWQSPGSFSGLAHFFFDTIPGFSVEGFYHIQSLYEAWNFWIIFTAGFTPIPYKVFTITAGAFQINFFWFLVASIVSRSARFFLVGGLIWWFGDPIRHFIDRYFNKLAIVFTALLLGGFLLIKYLV